MMLTLLFLMIDFCFMRLKKQPYCFTCNLCLVTFKSIHLSSTSTQGLHDLATEVFLANRLSLPPLGEKPVSGQINVSVNRIPIQTCSCYENYNTHRSLGKSWLYITSPLITVHCSSSPLLWKLHLKFQDHRVTDLWGEYGVNWVLSGI